MLIAIKECPLGVDILIQRRALDEAESEMGQSQ